MSQDITPLRQQYLDIKKQYPNTILFFRLGDFYETFDEDARKVSSALDIVLTSRPVAKGIRVPMAGIPYHAAENYLGRLIEKGYHVAIAEQVGEQPEKGLFTREVVRVITPGTIVEPSLLNAGQNNYLASVYLENNKAGIAYLDITTGEFSGTQLDNAEVIPQLRSELIRIHPAETLHAEGQALATELPGTGTEIPRWYFEPGRAAEILKSTFKVSTLEGFGLRSMCLTVQAAGALIKYLQETQKSFPGSITGFSTYHLTDFMVLDSETRRNLELTETIRDEKIEGSLLGVLDQTKTPMGKRMLRQWVNKPLLNLSIINERLDIVEYLFRQGVLRKQISDLLGELHDLERLVNRINARIARPPDLVALREDLRVLPKIVGVFPEGTEVLNPIIAEILSFRDELKLLDSAIEEDPPVTLANTGIIKPGYSQELDNIFSSSGNAREWINNLETAERKRTGIKNLKVGFNKVFGYYIEISRGNANLAPENYIRKQTLVNAERFITPELKEYETLVLNAEDQIHEVEVKTFHSVCEILSKKSDQFLKTARAIATLDCVVSLGTIAALNNYSRPIVKAEKGLTILEGRHPVVERIMTNERFIANDTTFSEGEIIQIITGPNMSGKSTFLRQVVLIVLMAQIGSFVPAKFAEIGLVDRIFTRIGAQDAIHSGQSTFMVEMIETANILNNATPRSLLILDEIGRGTSTYDGLSIAWAIIEYLHSHPKLKPFTLFATHYHELVELADVLPGVQNYNVAVTESEGKVIFLHKIIPGGTDRSYGIHVAQLAGLPNPIIQRATEILKQLEATAGKTLPDEQVIENQLRLFPENNPLVEAFKKVDLNALSPIQALNLLFEWHRNFFSE